MKNFFVRILVLVLGYLLLHGNGYSQTLILKSNSIPVPIYENQITTKTKLYLAEKFLDDLTYYIEILENSPLRYKVEISILYPDEIGFAGNYSVQGWINKTNCGLFPRCKEKENDKYFINIYDSPYNNDNGTKVFEDDLIEQNGSIITVLDYKVIDDKYWYKILYYNNGVLCSGWTLDYCLQFTTCN